MRQRCVLGHRGVHLILAYSWARPAMFVAGKGRGEMFLFLLFLLSFIFFLPCPSLSSLFFFFFVCWGFNPCESFCVVHSFYPVPLFHLIYYLFYLSSPFLGRPRWLSWMRRPTGDQEVVGSTPAEVGNILSWRLIVKYFLRSFSPFR